MFFISEIEAVTTAGVFQRVRAVDEKHRSWNVVFLTEFGKECLSNYAVRGGLKPCIK